MTTQQQQAPASLDNVLYEAKQLAINTVAGIAGAFGITLPSPGSTIFFTTGADHIVTTDATRVFNATLGGAGATLTAGDSLTGVGNTLNLTDSTGANSHDLLPAGVVLADIATVTLTTRGNAGSDARHAFDLSGVTGLAAVSLSSFGTHGDFLNSGSAASVGLAAHGAGDTVSLTSTSQALTIAGSATVSSIADDGLASLTVIGKIALGNAAGALSLAASNLTLVDLSAQTGSAFVTIANDHMTIKLGTGSSSIDLAGHLYETVILGTDAAYKASNATPNQTIANAVANDVLGFAQSPSSLTLGTPASSAATLQGFIHDLTAAISGTAGAAAYGSFNGDTYLVETANGALDAHDLTIVKLTGVHSLTVTGSSLTVDYNPGGDPVPGGI